MSYLQKRHQTWTKSNGSVTMIRFAIVFRRLI